MEHLVVFQKKIKVLINEFFGDKYIQNAPHSPDMAYPIETLWTELKIITIEEWIKIPKKFIQKLFKNFIKRCQKIIELKGGRLEPVHLN